MIDMLLLPLVPMTDALLAIIIVGIVSIAVVVNLGTIVIWTTRRIRACVAADGDRRLKRGSRWASRDARSAPSLQANLGVVAL
jgi:hypothetical protein